MKIFDYADLGSKRSWDFSMKGLTPEDDGIMPIIETDKEIRTLATRLIIDNAAYGVTSSVRKRMQVSYGRRPEIKVTGSFYSWRGARR